MSSAARAAGLRDWIGRHLDPLEDHDAVVGVHTDTIGGLPFEGEPAPAAVLVGLIERPQGYTVLLTRRADTLRNHTGQIALPGGRRDPGETAWETALREAEEEVGLERRFVTLSGLSTPMLTRTGFLITPVVGFIDPGFRLQPNPHEVADIFETPFLFLMDPANYEQRQGRTPAGDERRFYALTWEDRLVWGATAGMLRALHDRLQGEPGG